MLSVYVTPDWSKPPGRTTNRLGSTLLRTTRVPGTVGDSWIAASVAAADMLVEKLTEMGVSTGTCVAPSAGSMLRITGACPVVICQWWSTELTTPLGSVIPPASVNVYVVLGSRIARGWSRVNSVSPASQTIRQGASGPALNAASRLHEGIGRFTEKRPSTDAVSTGRSNSTVIGASAETPTEPRFGIRLMICGGLAKHPDRDATISPDAAQRAVRRTPAARRPRAAALVGAVEGCVDVDCSDGSVAALDLDARLTILGQGRNRRGRLVQGSLGFGVRPEDVAIAKQDDPRLVGRLHNHRTAHVLFGEVLEQCVEIDEPAEETAVEVRRCEQLGERGDRLAVQLDDVDDAIARIHVAADLEERRFALNRRAVAAERLQGLAVVEEDHA